MCSSCRCFLSIMRRLSLDSSLVLDSLGHLSGRRGSKTKGESGKRTRQSQSLDDARLEIQELNSRLRRQTIAEESFDRPDGRINSHSFKKHNKSFHKLFPEIPEEENLTHAFGCALQKELLYHGKLFVSEHHVSFHSSVLLKDTKVVIPAASVKQVKKHHSALSMLSVHTADGEKYSFVSLRHRDMCYNLLQTICSHDQAESVNGSPHLSSVENEGDPDMASSFSSTEDGGECELRRQSSIDLDIDSPHMSSEEVNFPAPSRSNSTRQSSLTEEDGRVVSWIRRIAQKVAPTFLFRAICNISFFFYLSIILMAFLLLMSGYIGLRINALEEQLNSLGALPEWSPHHGGYQET